MAREPGVNDESWSGQHQKVVEALRELAGKKNVPYLVAQETLWLLEGYVLSVSNLPETVGQAEHYLGYVEITEHELLPERMLELFRALKGHASSWSDLRVHSLSVVKCLIAFADSVQAQGAEVVGYACQTAALGANPENWEGCRSCAAIDENDRTILSRMTTSFVALRKPVERVQASVDHVQSGLADFRDTARFKLGPAVQEKIRALERLQKARLSELSLSENPSAINYAPGGSDWACAQLKVNLNKFKASLSLNVAGAGTLHSAWQRTDAYLEQSERRLQSMETQQELADFMIKYQIFLAQWAGIKTCAQEQLSAFQAP